MFGVLVVAALALGGLGVLLGSQATFGVVLVGLGCLSGILARLVQAREQHAQLMTTLRSGGTNHSA